jgi:ABC-type Fe3+ transport system permease subunit
VSDDSRLHSPRARWIALVVVCLGQLMSIVDGTIVNVALGGRDGIQHDLHFTHALLSGYQLAFRIGAGCVVVALVAAVALVRAPRRADAVAERVMGAETAS